MANLENPILQKLAVNFVCIFVCKLQAGRFLNRAASPNDKGYPAFQRRQGMQQIRGHRGRASHAETLAALLTSAFDIRTG